MGAEILHDVVISRWSHEALLKGDGEPHPQTRTEVKELPEGCLSPNEEKTWSEPCPPVH